VRLAPAAGSLAGWACALFAFASSGARAESLRYLLADRETIESRLGEYRGTDRERGARLKRMFIEAGCSEGVSEQPLKFARPPNVICVLPGVSNRTIIVGAHFDSVPGSAGVADNWSGAALLPSLYKSVKIEPRQHTYIFIGFSDEEEGLVGSSYYARKMTREQVATTDAMVNLDTLGLAPTKVWARRSDERLTDALVVVAKQLDLPLGGVNFGRVGSTDSESFAARKIPRITIHSITQENHDADIIHTGRDNLSAMKLDAYYDTYRLVTAYLVFLDGISR
jgi:hypothetical protein